MKLSVAYNFDEALVSQISQFPEVEEVYGKLTSDFLGGGRSSATLPDVNKRTLKEHIAHCHEHGIRFNYLLNPAALDGSEQTRRGQRRIRSFLSFLSDAGVDAVTVASPLLLRMVKKEFPQLRVRVSVFATIDSPRKAREWQDQGADALCISGIAVNRDFRALREIRAAVDCELQLIVNSNCLPDCAYENTHMHLLTQASRAGHRNKGFSVDYCLVHCNARRMHDIRNLLCSIWIRPEDLSIYEEFGYDSFKIIERSSPTSTLVERVRGYAERRYDGNLWDLVGPTAMITPKQGASRTQMLRMAKTMFRPHKAKISSLLTYRTFAQNMIENRSPEGGPGIYIDNRKLDGFLRPIVGAGGCMKDAHGNCSWCDRTLREAVSVDESYRGHMNDLTDRLEHSFDDGSFW